MSMSKKHFIELADVIREHNIEVGPQGDRFSPDLIHLLADFCASQNPRFDRARWFGYIAGLCGPSGGKV